MKKLLFVLLVVVFLFGGCEAVFAQNSINARKLIVDVCRVLDVSNCPLPPPIVLIDQGNWVYPTTNALFLIGENVILVRSDFVSDRVLVHELAHYVADREIGGIHISHKI